MGPGGILLGLMGYDDNLLQSLPCKRTCPFFHFSLYTHSLEFRFCWYFRLYLVIFVVMVRKMRRKRAQEVSGCCLKTTQVLVVFPGSRVSIALNNNNVNGDLNQFDNHNYLGVRSRCPKEYFQ